jgi:hypothetical protein
MKQLSGRLDSVYTIQDLKDIEIKAGYCVVLSNYRVNMNIE